MAAPSYQQMVQDLKPSGTDGPLNRAVYEEVPIPMGGGTSLDELFPPAPRPITPPPTEPMKRFRDPVPPAAPLGPPPGPAPSGPAPSGPAPVPPTPAPSHGVNKLDLALDSFMDRHQKAALLVLALYLLVSSTLVQNKLAEVVPELFSNRDGYVSFVGRGLLLAGLFYLVRRFMVTAE